MNFTMLTQRIVANGLETLHVDSVSYTNGISHILHRIYTTVPNNIVNVNVVTNKCFCVIVNVNNTN